MTQDEHCSEKAVCAEPFDTVAHNTPLDKQDQRADLSVTVLQRFRSYLAGRHSLQSWMIKKNRPEMPPGSTLGPVLFSLYVPPLGNIIRNHSIHFHYYTIDTHLYTHCKLWWLQLHSQQLDWMHVRHDSVDQSELHLQLNQDKDKIMFIRDIDWDEIWSKQCSVMGMHYFRHNIKTKFK